MPRLLSKPFIEAFVERCLEQGLTKEATAKLLSQESLNMALTHPEFRKGYESAGGPREVVEIQIKEAGWGKLAAGLGATAGAAAMGYGANKVGNAVADWWGAPKDFSWDAAKRGRWGRNSVNTPGMKFDVPYMSERSHEKWLRDMSNKTADMNRKLNETEDKDRIANADPGSMWDYRNQQSIDARNKNLRKIRDKWSRGLADQQARMEQANKDVDRRMKRLDRRENSWYTAPMRWGDKLLGKNNYNQQRAELHGERTEYTARENAASTLRRRAEGGFVSGSAAMPSVKQIQKDLFPKYEIPTHG